MERLLTPSSEVLLLEEDCKTVSLKEAVGHLAISLFVNLREFSNGEESENKEHLKEKIEIQTEALNSLSNALTAITHAN